MIFFQDGTDELGERLQQLSFGEIKARFRKRKNRKNPHHIPVSLQWQMHCLRLWTIIGKLPRGHAMTKGPSCGLAFLFIERKGAGRMTFRGHPMMWKPGQKRSVHSGKRVGEVYRCS